MAFLNSSRAVPAAVLAAALALSACGSSGSGERSGGGGSQNDGQPVDMSRVSEAAKRGKNATVTITAGETGTIADVTYTCEDDGEDCVVTVKGGKPTYTGGTVTAEDSEGFTAQGDLEDTEDDLDDKTNKLSVSQRVNTLFSETTANLKTVSDAKMKAEAAPAKATEANKMLSAFQVKGDSGKAQASAQKILDAEKDLSDGVVTSVKGAINDLKSRKKTAEGLDENAPQKAELIRAINTAIQEAEAHLKAIEKVKKAQAGGPGSVGLLALGIKGADGKGTATTWAEKVAQEMEAAATPFIGLATGAGANKVNLPMNTGGKTKVSTWSDFRTDANGVTATTDRIRLGSSVPGTPFYGNPNIKFKDDVGGRAKTWKEILGQDKITKKTVQAGHIDVAPLEEGMDVGGNLSSQPAGNITGIGYSYKGIGGNAYCFADSCTVTNGKLGAGWYWTPTDDNKNNYWTINVTTGNYEKFTDYAEYGYWMGENSSGIVTDTGYFGIPKDENTAMSMAALTNTALGDGNEATYRGKAFGLSIVTEADGDNGRKAVRSGDFTADVTLTAKFGTSPKVEGTVSNFQGNAVNRSWRATLAEGPLKNFFSSSPPSNAQNFGLVTVTGQDNGRWSARAYGGDANKRPTGITGDFQAFFEDGRALGGYATRKQ